MSWMDGWDYSNDEWDEGSWDDAWDYGQEDTGGDMSDQGYDWDAIFGNSDSSENTTNQAADGSTNSGTNWMNMFASGVSAYAGSEEDKKKAEQQAKQAKELLMLKAQLDEEQYKRRQQELKDAYGQYAGMPGQPSGAFNLLSTKGAYQPQQKGATYYGG